MQVRQGMAGAGHDVSELQRFSDPTATFFRAEGMRIEVTVYG